MVIWIPKKIYPNSFVVAASAVQQLQTTERETTEAVAKCLNCEPDRRGGGGYKKDQDWTKSLLNWYSKRHGDARTIINFYRILTFFISLLKTWAFGKYE